MVLDVRGTTCSRCKSHQVISSRYLLLAWLAEQQKPRPRVAT